MQRYKNERCSLSVQQYHLFLRNAESAWQDDTLKDIITRIDPKLFFKVNRKFIVNTASVKEVIKHSSQKIELVLQPAPATDAEVFISKFQIAEWKQRMQG